ncbi:hypothetical protein ACVBEH_07590 [Roseateles sp. GG27B]
MFTSSSFWLLLTRLGEAQILFPLAAAAAAWLWLRAEQATLARRWVLCLCLSTALTTASKLAFIGWGLGWAARFHRHSGHAMVSLRRCRCWPGRLCWGRSSAAAAGRGLCFSWPR